MSIPVHLLQPYINEFVGLDKEGRLQTLVAKTGLSESLINRINTGYIDHVTFDVADKILCATNAVMAWYQDCELGSLYTDSDPHVRKCAALGCDNLILPHPDGLPRPPKKYCSQRCNTRTWHRKNRQKRIEYMRQYRKKK